MSWSGLDVERSAASAVHPASPRWLLLVGVGSTALFATLTVAVSRHSGIVSSADIQWHFWALTHRSEMTINAARWLTWGGATIVTLPALVVVGALTSPRGLPVRSRIGRGLLLAGIASLGVYAGLLVNAAVAGVRPLETDWAGTASGPSFPSGHTTAATIFAAASVWALCRRWSLPRQRVVIITAAVGYAVVVGLTRVWLGVHWPSDVVGGWLFGVAWASLAAAAFLLAGRRWPSGFDRFARATPG